MNLEIAINLGLLLIIKIIIKIEPIDQQLTKMDSG